MTKTEAIELTQQAYDVCLNHHTGTARILASFILGCYNSSWHKVELDNVSSLDKEHFEMALGVIWLRHFGLEPHRNEVVKNGNELIKQLANKFQPETFEGV